MEGRIKEKQKPGEIWRAETSAKVIESLKETRENFHGGVERRARAQGKQF